MSARFNTLPEWLRWQEQLHVREIDLGLERARRVLEALGLPPTTWPVITVAGTNGKGSTVAMLESMLRSAGLRVGCYSSPHLLRYNERIRMDGVPVEDQPLCEAFARVDAARADVSLTYFEFGTLAAFDLFSRAGLDAAVLEVGLGGRLDAVNAIDADVAVVTGIGIDHVEWLGPDRESIGREKAGVFRSGHVAICSDPEPPTSIAAQAQSAGARLRQLGRDFHYQGHADGWDWQGVATSLPGLPLPALSGRVQLQNAAGVLAAIEALERPALLSPAVVARGLTSVRLPGRFQVLPGNPPVILDVAHNPHAAVRLAETLAEQAPVARTVAVTGMLRDKDAAGVFERLLPFVDSWYVCELDSPRAAPAAQLAAALAGLAAPGEIHLAASVPEALEAARAEAGREGRVLVFGSFLTVAAALALQAQPSPRQDESPAPMTDLNAIRRVERR
ncbi:MAG TPA: bifunctional tetrahydrofolate synthase/dihydrofolate synthase [Gammaproteobacteria bacterium]|nr:bifunctional tetrahydrofolate synthase/dihydrofolate synthase [Gammaproteobacteria bacterium]